MKHEASRPYAASRTPLRASTVGTDVAHVSAAVKLLPQHVLWLPHGLSHPWIVITVRAVEVAVVHGDAVGAREAVCDGFASPEAPVRLVPPGAPKAHHQLVHCKLPLLGYERQRNAAAVLQVADASADDGFDGCVGCGGMVAASAALAARHRAHPRRPERRAR